MWLHLLFVRGFWLGFRREIRDLGAISAPRRRAVAARRYRGGAAPGSLALKISSLNISSETRAPPDTPPGGLATDTRKS